MEYSFNIVLRFYLNVMYEYFSEASWQHVTGLGCRTITNIWHQILTLETPTNSVVNTFRFTPVSLKTKKTYDYNLTFKVCIFIQFWKMWNINYLQFRITIWLMPNELLCPLFDNFRSVYGTNSHLNLSSENKKHLSKNISPYLRWKYLYSIK